MIKHGKQRSPELANAAERREKHEPTEATGPIPRGFLVFIGAVLSFGGYYLIQEAPVLDYAGDRRSAQLEAKAIESTGESLYAARCTPCHQATGLGVPGAFPPLAGSSWVTGSPKTLARILLRGLSGPIEVQGQVYNGAMPSQASLSDEDVAKLTSYIRTNFGNDASPIDETLVANVRSNLQGRSAPWTVTELIAARKEDKTKPEKAQVLPQPNIKNSSSKSQ